MGNTGNRFPFSEVSWASETWLPKNGGGYLDNAVDGHPPVSLPACIFQSPLSSPQPPTAVTLLLFRVSYDYKYCSSCMPSHRLQNASPCFLTSLHLPSLCFWPNTTCGFPVASTIHLGTPKAWIIVLNAFLKSRPNSFWGQSSAFLLPTVTCSSAISCHP